MPEIRERFEDTEELIRQAFDDFRRQLWTALPGKVVEDSDGKTAKVQPTIKGRTYSEDGEAKSVEYPQHEAIVHFTRGGGWALTHPIKKGDEGVIIYCSRNIDDWHDQGGAREPLDRRTHDMSDCIFIPGIGNKTRDLKNISTDTIQFRSEQMQGSVPLHYFEVDAKNGKIVTSVNGGKRRLTIGGDGITVDSDAEVTINAPKLKTGGLWHHSGAFRATGVIQSDMGLKSQLIYGVAGVVPDVPKG
jgi:hypothetical protein